MPKESRPGPGIGITAANLGKGQYCRVFRTKDFGAYCATVENLASAGKTVREMIALCQFFQPLKIVFGSGNLTGMIIATNAIPANILRGVYLITNTMSCLGGFSIFHHFGCGQK